MFRVTSDNYVIDANGNRTYTNGPPATTIVAEAMNSIQEEIANVIEQSGIQLYPDGTTDTKTQLWEAIQRAISPYDSVITSQASFNNVIERVAANQYKIKNDYTSLFFKNPGAGGYAMTGSGSPLSGGDTWGYIETNLCKHVEFESGTYIGFGATQGYIKVNTADCYLKNVQVNGDIGTAAAISQSFLLANIRVTFDNCKTTNRNSNIDFAGFQGSGTALHNITSKYSNCSVYTIDGSDKLDGFKDCMNISNGLVYDLDGTVDEVAGFKDSDNISNCYVYDIQGNNTTQGFRNCNNISSSYVNQVDAPVAGFATGFYLSNNISACRVEDLDGAAVYAFNTCNQVSATYVYDLDSSGGSILGFTSCNQISSTAVEDIDSTAPVLSAGFKDSDNISSCYSYDIQSANNQDAYGYQNCDQVAASMAEQIDATGTGDAYGFKNCLQIAGIKAIDIDSAAISVGYDTCDQISSSRAEDIDSSGGEARGYATCNQVSSSYAYDIASSASGGFGFRVANRLSACYANKIDYTGVGVNNSYGFYDCDLISSALANDVDVGGAGSAEGFADCVYGSALNSTEAVNSNNDWFSSTDGQIPNKWSCPSVWT